MERGVAGISSECSNNREGSCSSMIGKKVDAHH
jgi:hypothetical protein